MKTNGVKCDDKTCNQRNVAVVVTWATSGGLRTGLKSSFDTTRHPETTQVYHTQFVCEFRLKLMLLKEEPLYLRTHKQTIVLFVA